MQARVSMQAHTGTGILQYSCHHRLGSFVL
jgi:hypothetical protein